MVLFLYGSDSYRVHERAQVLEDAFRTKFDPRGLNIVRMDSSTFDHAAFHNQLKTGGLFVQKKFITLQNLWALKKDQQEELQTELANVDTDTILCITADIPPNKNNALFKQLLKADKVEEYAELTPVQLRTFIRNVCQKAQATISPDAVDYLAAAIGTDVWRLHHELNKLTHYNKHVSRENAQEFVSSALDENIFHLTDALGLRNCKEASRLLSEQLESGANEHYLLTMLGRHISTLAKIKKTNGEGLKMHPYVLKKSLIQAQRFSMEQLARLHFRILEIDQKTKTGAADARVLLDLFIVEACR
jgi:DNA polymerase-3 subunit delta